MFMSDGAMDVDLQHVIGSSNEESETQEDGLEELKPDYIHNEDLIAVLEECFREQWEQLHALCESHSVNDLIGMLKNSREFTDEDMDCTISAFLPCAWTAQGYHSPHIIICANSLRTRKIWTLSTSSTAKWRYFQVSNLNFMTCATDCIP